MALAIGKTQPAGIRVKLAVIKDRNRRRHRALVDMGMIAQISGKEGRGLAEANHAVDGPRQVKDWWAGEMGPQRYG